MVSLTWKHILASKVLVAIAHNCSVELGRTLHYVVSVIEVIERLYLGNDEKSKNISYDGNETKLGTCDVNAHLMILSDAMEQLFHESRQLSDSALLQLVRILINL